MKIKTLNASENIKEDFDLARRDGYITFIYVSADPEKTVGTNKFFYVRSPEELSEKIALIEADKLVEEEVKRF